MKMTGNLLRIYANQDAKELSTSYPFYMDILLEYMATTTWSCWLHITNLLNQIHPSYTGYPEKKRNITFGLQYKW